MTCLDLFTVQVDRERPHLLLAPGELDLETESFVELIYVLLEPWSERDDIACMVL
ncbi:MAG TPA: hypothetical protein VKZ50_06070 [bacterium]|nr:hypothetical protein [bacterium]